MYIILFFISCIIALLFTLLSSKLTFKWVRISFKLYGIIFTGMALTLEAMYVSEHRGTLVALSENFERLTETTVAPSANSLISQYSIKGTIHLEAPHIKQLPEPPRGCEVTSLAMLLNYHDVDVTKMELAKHVKRDKTTYKETDEGIYFGNPHNGFVGDMYSFENPGIGVYHEPIADLARTYLDNRIYDFSGQDFSEIIHQLNQNRPVWVIINTTYHKLSKALFTTWHTKDGPIDITRKEHSVLITGYDHDYIYFNDPLNRAKKAPIEEFKAAWVQMGKQAITVR